jgi:ATP-dependent DNA ligase
MLAEKFCPQKVRFPVWCEEKVDGVRALIVVDDDGAGSAWSRAGNRLPAAQSIADEVALAMGPGVVVDAELFAGSWSRTVSAVKRRSPVGLRLHVFDALSLAEWTSGGSAVSLMERRERLEALSGRPGVVVVDGVLLEAVLELERLLEAVLEAGGEGIMLKDPASGYSCSRTWAWMKMKPGRPECW